jgi:hypothetical protein
MYTTIEAEVDNGVIVGAAAMNIPRHAHVLITLLDNKKESVPVVAPGKESLRGALKKFANPRLLSAEQDAWADAMEHRHEQN